MARPDYTDVAPRMNLNIGALSGTAAIRISIRTARARRTCRSSGIRIANTELRVRRCTTRTSSPSSRIGRCTQILPVAGRHRAICACTPAGTQLFNCPFTINLRSNGGGGTIKGVELAVTKPICGGFGVQANYTYADARGRQR